jgi:threonine dehydrogenase-like Zn-dependent dehydrogenase
MKAVCWEGTNDVRVERVPDPAILNPRDAIVRVTSTAICGSDLHLMDGFIPTMKSGDILGHEFMGEVVDVGRGVTTIKKGDRVIVPFPIACGRCYFCTHGMWACCDNSNPNASIAEALYGFSSAGLFGYSHMLGGYAGGQAEYVRVPYADVGPFKVPDHLTDEQVLFMTDIFPTGYMADENCGIKAGDTVAVWGCGPVGQFAIRSAFLLGAGQVIAIDTVPERLQMAASAGAQTLDSMEDDVFDRLRAATGGIGPDAHRCGGHGGPRAAHRLLVRQSEDDDVPRDRSGQHPAAGDSLLPQGRHRLDSRCVRRLHRQGADGRRVQQGAHAEDGADPRPQVPDASARPHRERPH